MSLDLKNILFRKNQFIRNERKGKSDSNPLKESEKALTGNFYGAFLALPRKMIERIKFKENTFTSPSEGIHIIQTDK